MRITGTEKVFTALLLSLYTVSALRCYSCQDGCSEDFSPQPSMETTCEGIGYSLGATCVKYTDNNVVHRGCYPGLHDDYCADSGNLPGGKKVKDICFCKKDVCNVSSDISANMVFILSTTVASLVCWFWT